MSADPKHVFSAGAGRSRIRYPSTMWPIEGFTGEHDPLYARVLLLEGATRLVLVVVDQTSLSPGPLADVRAVAAAATATPIESVVVCVSHTFSAPHLASLAETPERLVGRMADARDAVMDAVASAASSASATLRPASLGFGSGMCDINVNRDIESADGWTLGADAEGFSDKSVSVLRVDDADGDPIAVLANYSVQPSVLSDSIAQDGSRRTSGDLAGEAMRHVENAYDDRVVALFLLGAAGDQAPVLTAVRTVLDRAGHTVRLDAGGPAHILPLLLGERLGAEIVRVAEQIPERDRTPTLSLSHGVVQVGGQEPVAREHFSPRREHDYTPAPPRDLPYSILRIGRSAIIGVQPELNAKTGLSIKDSSPLPWTAVTTMWNGGAKYLPDEASFDRLTYEALSSRFVRGSAELLAAAIAADLREADSPAAGC